MAAVGCFSSDGSMWTCPENADNFTRLYSVKDNHELALLDNGTTAYLARFSEDDRTLAVATYNAILLWKHVRLPGLLGWLTIPFVWFALAAFTALLITHFRYPVVCNHSEPITAAGKLSTK